MALIRQSDVRFTAREAVRLDLGDLARQGERLAAAARAESERLVREGRAERERLLSNAAEEGRRAGLARGLEEGRAAGRVEGSAAALAERRERLSALEAAWSRELDGFVAARDTMLVEARRDVLTLAIRLGEMVARRSLELRPELVREQVEAVLAALVRPTRLVIAVHPDDAALVQEALPALSARYGAAAHVELTPAPELARGSVVARTPGGGTIDASIDTQLARIAEMLLPQAAGAGGEARA